MNGAARGVRNALGGLTMGLLGVAVGLAAHPGRAVDVTNWLYGVILMFVATAAVSLIVAWPSASGDR